MAITKKSLANVLANNPSLSTIIVWTMLFAFLTVSFVAFTPSYMNSFLIDDYKHLDFIQPFLDKPYTIYQAFNPYFIGWYYRPTQLIFFTLFRLLFGTNPLPYYVAMLLLHAVNIVLVYNVARIWGNGRFGAICAAGLFAVIATHQDAVGWISAVSILFAAAFSLLALYSLRAYLNGPQQTIRLITAFLMAGLAMLSREEAVALYPLMLLIWLFRRQSRPRQSEIWLFAGFGLLVVAYIVMIFLRPTWTSYAGAILDRNLADLASIQSFNRFFLNITGSYLAIENIPNDAGWLTTSIIFGMMLVVGLALWRGNSSLRLGILWTAALLLFLYIVIWLFNDHVAHRYLYLPWLGVSLVVGTLADQLYRKYPGNHAIQIAAFLTLIGIFAYQTPISRQRQQQWQNDAEITAQNRAQIEQLVPEINEFTHFFAYEMPPVTDYIQSMAGVWYDTKLGSRGGYWKRLMDSGSANRDDWFFNYEDGLVYNAMPELQEHDETIFVWQESPAGEIIRLDGTSIPEDVGAYELNRIVGPPGQKRFGFFMHPPAPEDGWTSLTYTTAVPYNSDLAFGIHKEWGQVNGEDGMMFRVNIVDNSGDQHMIYQTSLDTMTENWTEPSLPMDDYWGQTILLQFQVHANANLLHDHGYWANPRFVVDNPD